MHAHRAYHPPRTLTRRYEAFLGVDFSTDSSQVDERRSPWAPNLISDSGGFPEKRAGYRTRWTLPGAVNGIYPIESGGREAVVVHAGDGLYWLGEPGVDPAFLAVLTGERGCGFLFADKLWLLCGGRYVTVEMPGIRPVVKNVADFATVPTTSISRDPKGGGTPLDPVNLLSPKRTNTFLGTEFELLYQLDAAELDETPLNVTVNGVKKTEGTDYLVNRRTGAVIFSDPPGPPPVMGADNVSVTYSRTIEGYAERVTRGRCAASFGLGAGNAVFVGGSPERPNLDWRCVLDDPTYFPDTGYAVVGGGRSAIMGYLRVGEELAIVKQPSDDDSTVFLRSARHSEAEGIAFPLRAGVSGVGAVSRQAVLNLRDDPLFLSPSGVFAVASRAVSLEKTVQNRSRRVDARLTAEPGLEEAAAAEWGNYCVLCVNGRCYVADARKQTPGVQEGSFEYEWYHWDNIPARTLRRVGRQLWFGTADGRVCVFREDADMTRYSDDGAPIVASWSTKADDDGDFMRLKTMPRRGAGVLIKPYTRSSVRVLVRTEKDFGREVGRARMDVFGFDDIDFTRLSFSTADTPQVAPFSSDARRYQTVQIIVENDALDEGFGVFGILRRYTVGRYIR